jgi:predicted O-methyltransferase YrrM
MCARACGARQIIEFGTSFGVSTIHLACALKDNGAGRVIGTELEAGKAGRARQNLADAGLAEFVEIRVGDALETLSSGIEREVDVLLLDGAVSLYLPVLKLVERHLRAGAMVIGENAVEQSPGYLDYVRNPQNGYLSIALPFQHGRGNELTIRTY